LHAKTLTRFPVVQKSPGAQYDPFLTLFVALSDDELPTDIREIPFGHGSRVQPRRILQSLQAAGVGPDALFTDAHNVGNPDPNKSQLNEGRREQGAEPTILDATVDSNIQIAVGRLLAPILSNTQFSAAFRQHMGEFIWDLDLRQLRKRVIQYIPRKK
jgi:hypothetical protein